MAVGTSLHYLQAQAMAGKRKNWLYLVMRQNYDLSIEPMVQQIPAAGIFRIQNWIQERNLSFANNEWELRDY